MDVQGHEWHVLQGAASLLDRGTPIVTEFWPYGLSRAGVSPEAFIETFAGRYSHYIDLRMRPIELRPVSGLGAMFEKYSGTAVSDMLLLRQPQ